MRLTRNARKHGVRAEDISRVLAAPLWTVSQGDVVLHIGLTPTRDLIEVVVAPGDPVTVVHAMRLRPGNYHHLRPVVTADSTSPPARCAGDRSAVGIRGQEHQYPLQ